MKAARGWWAGAVRDASLDLLLGSTCVACAAPGRLLCAACAAALPTRGVPAWPDPVPPGLVAPWAVGAYDSALRSLVVGHKERALWSLRRPLGALLGVSVLAGLAEVDPRAPVVLVPVPSRAAAVRERAYDPTAALVGIAAGRLRASGREVVVAPLLRTSSAVLDQAGLGAGARAANLSGAMSCPSAGVRRLARKVESGWVVLCDDVITSGATVREAQRALEASGVPPHRVAVVAATRRTRPSSKGAKGP